MSAPAMFQAPAAPAPNSAPDPAAAAPTTPASTPATTPAADVPKGLADDLLISADSKPKTEVPSDATKQKDGSEAAAAPYEPFTLPDGFRAADEDIAVFQTLAGELKLDQTGAQKIVDLGVTLVKNAREQFDAEADQEAAAIRGQWKKDLQADPELGGAKLQETQTNLNHFGSSKLASPELNDYLRETGLLFNPLIARLLSQIGASMKEQPVLFGGAPPAPAPETSPGQRVFSNSKHV